MTREMIDDETRAFLYDHSRLQEFGAALNSTARRRVKQTTLWSAFAATYRDLPSGPERRMWLLLVLERLAEQGTIRLPATHGKQWDRSSAIAIPLSITVGINVPENGPRTAWRQFPWHPSLQWIVELRNLAPDQFAFLQHVHKGLVEGWFLQPESFKYRSLQLTGNEKRLERLLRGTLFGPGRVTLKMLGCEPAALPLAAEQLSSRPSMLIFENAAPYMLARSVAVSSGAPRFGRLAYGAGKQVLKAVGYFAMIEPTIEEIYYVGDLDAEGLKTASELQQLSNVIPVRAAREFHRAMLASAAHLRAPMGWPVKKKQPLVISNPVLSFLHTDLRTEVAAVIAAGRRIPEEVLSRASMTQLLFGT